MYCISRTLPFLAAALTAALVAALAAIALAAATPASATTFGWDIEGPCQTGGSWLDVNCWNPDAIPNSREDAVILAADYELGVLIPTSSIFQVFVNHLSIGPNFSVTVGPNMVLTLSRSSNNLDPSLVVDGVLTVNSPDFGGSSLNLSGFTTGSADPLLSIAGQGEIRLGNNASISAGNYGRINIHGGIELYGGGSTSQPAKLFGEIHNQGGEVVVLSGRMNVIGDLYNSNGGFVQVEDQFQQGNVRLVVSGSVRGGEVYPGPGVVEVYGGRLVGVELQPGVVEVANLGHFAGTVTTKGGTEVRVLPGETLVLDGDFEGGPPRLENNGIVRLGTPASLAYLRIDGGACELAGNGALVLEHPSGQVDNVTGSYLRNLAGHSIVGQGYLLTPIQNAGLIVADGGDLRVYDTISALGGDAVAQGDSTSPGTLWVQAPFRTRNLRLADHGRLRVKAGLAVVLDGDFVVQGSDETAFQWEGSNTLDMVGQGATQGLEIAGEDLGAVSAGFTGNFSIPRLTVRLQDSFVYLRELEDNGNRTTGDEALYVGALEVQAGATLQLNGYCLYTLVNGVPYRVQAGDGAMFGGGTIVDGTMTSAGDSPSGPVPVVLHGASPNPFNPSTTLRFELAAPSPLRLTVHDLAGRTVRQVARGWWPAGAHELPWDGRDDAGARLASGSYFLRIELPQAAVSRPVILLK